jgi:hypothetical protein
MGVPVENWHANHRAICTTYWNYTGHILSALPDAQFGAPLRPQRTPSEAHPTAEHRLRFPLRAVARPE